MGDPRQPPPPDRVLDRLEQDTREQAVDCLNAVHGAPVEDRKAVLRALRTFAEDQPAVVGRVSPALTRFLEDQERAVRLTTAKLFVELAETEPDTVVPAVPSLADRLADDEEFYYVRARSAEALGYVALDHPDAVDDPEMLADFRIGLSFDEPEVKEKLAKALECVALGNPGRLRHQVSSLAEHLDHERELVRYHLCTALVAVGSEHPTTLTDARTALTERLTDGNPYVRGRAAEALGLLARSDATDATPRVDEVEPGEGEAGSFVTERVRFARGDRTEADHDGAATVASIRRETDDIVEAITSPDEGECPHCGLALPEGGPPMCPRCGAPY
jgi:HEAT repeat protein